MLYKSSPKKRVHFTQQICRDSHDSREIICNGKCLAMTWGTLLSMNGAKSRLNYTSRNPGVNTYESYDSSWEILGNIYIYNYIYMIYNIWEMFGKFRASQAVHVLHSPVAQPWLQLHDVLQDARAIFWGHLNVRRWLLCTGEESEDLLGGYAQSVSAQQPVHYIYTIYIYIYIQYIYIYIHTQCIYIYIQLMYTNITVNIAWI